METYTFEHNTLTIIDRELNLSIQEHFDPVRVPETRQEQPLKSHHYAKVVQQEEGPLEALYVEHQGQLDGQYVYFYPSGSIKMELFYSAGKLHGPSTFYSETGVVLSRSWYIQGNKQGKCWLYYSTATLYSLQRFVDGRPHGKQEYYYPDGTIKILMTYSHGKLEDTQLFNASSHKVFGTE